AEHGFDPARAFVVGDKEVDVELGHGVGAVGILVRTGHGPDWVNGSRADVIVDDLAAAAERIERLVTAQTA
ncbi:MAG: hypothetical protein RLZZ501_1803, partial [Pseudomonadota bacterium]